jgi:hypothetical protein
MDNTAPRITATHLRQALATRAGVVVQDQRDGVVRAIPQGLTKLQSQDPDLVVLLTNEEAEFYVRGAGGSYGAGARTATTVLRWEFETIEANLADYAAKAVQL